MATYRTSTPEETEALGERLAGQLQPGTVVAFFGGMGMGKTVFVRGLARGLQAEDDVSSPTFALVHEYGGRPPLVHFDMYRITSWDDLYSTGFFDYIDQGCVLAVEWSENIENALPDGTVFVQIRKTEQEGERILEIEGEGIQETLES